MESVGVRGRSRLDLDLGGLRIGAGVGREGAHTRAIDLLYTKRWMIRWCVSCVSRIRRVPRTGWAAYVMDRGSTLLPLNVVSPSSFEGLSVSACGVGGALRSGCLALGASLNTFPASMKCIDKRIYKQMKDETMGWEKVANFEPDLLLAEGRRGDNIMDAKAGNADSTAVLGAFVLAFVLQSLHDDLADIDENDFMTLMSWFCLILSAACGLSSVLLLTFTSAKLKRLVGRSHFLFGTDESAEELAPYFGGMDCLVETLQQHVMKPNKSSNNLRIVYFHAREWYNGSGGRDHFNAGLALLVVELLMYMGSQAAMVLASDKSSAFIYFSTAVLLGPCAVTLLQLCRSGAIRDLA